MSKQNQDLILKNNVQELHTLAVFLEKLGESWNLYEKTVQQINLALEEAFSNIVYYGFKDHNIHEIVFSFERMPDGIRIVLTDDGIPFDPTQQDEPDTNLSPEEKPIGGLGIFLIKKLMDVVTYKRVQQTNQLTLYKKTL